MKADERVLCVPAAHLRAVGAFAGFRPADEAFRAALLDPAVFSYQPRSTCETDSAFLQLIPYVVLRCGDSVFHYRRGASGTEARLRAKRSVGLGGHISDADAGAADPYYAGMMRELTEEVDIASKYERQFLGVIFDPGTEVGKVHLGLVHLFWLDTPDVTAREAGIADGGFAAVAELLAAAEFETWSQLVLAALR